MAERPDLRQIAVSIGEALEGFERDDLAKMLTYVFKEYVVEGAPPVLVSQVDGIEALDGLSFAEVIEQLQARLDLPELEHFAVDGNQVRVRVGGVMSPIGGGADARPAARAPAQSASPPTPAPAPTAAAEPPRATAEEAVRRGRGDLAGGQRGAPAPAPARGISVSSRPRPMGAASPAPAQPAPAAAATATPTPAEPETDDKPAPGDDDASVRFSLLELD